MWFIKWYIKFLLTLLVLWVFLCLTLKLCGKLMPDHDTGDSKMKVGEKGVEYTNNPDDNTDNLNDAELLRQVYEMKNKEDIKIWNSIDENLKYMDKNGERWVIILTAEDYKTLKKKGKVKVPLSRSFKAIREDLYLPNQIKLDKWTALPDNLKYIKKFIDEKYNKWLIITNPEYSETIKEKDETVKEESKKRIKPPVFKEKDLREYEYELELRDTMDEEMAY